MRFEAGIVWILYIDKFLKSAGLHINILRKLAKTFARPLSITYEKVRWLGDVTGDLKNITSQSHQKGQKNNLENDRTVSHWHLEEITTKLSLNTLLCTLKRSQPIWIYHRYIKTTWLPFVIRWLDFWIRGITFLISDMDDILERTFLEFEDVTYKLMLKGRMLSKGILTR